MSKPRILLLGATGMLGSMLSRRLQTSTELFYTGRSQSSPLKVEGTYISSLNADNWEALDRVIDEINPHQIVNCIGLIKQRPEGKDPVRCIKINSLLPHLLAQKASQIGARVITFSTDCVFSGKSGLYTDESISDAEDIYGKSKFLGELTDAPGLTIRSSIIGPELNSSLSLFDWFRSNKNGAVKGYTRAFYSGVTTLEMAKLVEFLIFERPDLFGRWTVASDRISKFELLNIINDEFALKIAIAKDDDFYCDRSLVGDRFTKETKYQIPTWPQMIKDLKEFLERV